MLTTEEFIKKAKIYHNDKYDYSLVEYNGYTTKIKIICPEHGVFEQKPNNHLHNKGCSKCGKIVGINKIKFTTEKFIEKSKKVHGDKYDYSVVEYVDTRIKVKIICPEHGVFEQTPNKHLIGQGCVVCSGKNTPTTEEFIEKSKKIHGDKYDYSLVKYKDSYTKIKIICPEHGVFKQKPSMHLSGNNCKMCSKLYRFLTTEEFIIKSKEKHGDKYDYSIVKYIDNITDVNIICKKHGKFNQKPSSHLKTDGCPECSNINKFLTIDEFLKRAKKVHGDKYDYSVVEYINCKTKVKIICPEHGVFEQIPDSHYNGCGCSNCSSHGKASDKFLYLMYDNVYNLTKIGVSKNPIKRKESIDKKLQIIKTYEKCGSLEIILHKNYSKKQKNHPIYLDGKTEWFELTKSEISNIDIFIKSHIEGNFDHNQ